MPAKTQGWSSSQAMGLTELVGNKESRHEYAAHFPCKTEAIILVVWIHTFVRVVCLPPITLITFSI
jgi:formate-dependent nitrite reductase membrane component NrfD